MVPSNADDDDTAVQFALRESVPSWLCIYALQYSLPNPKLHAFVHGNVIILRYFMMSINN